MDSNPVSRRDFVRGSAASLALATTGAVLVGCSETPDTGRTPVSFLAILDPNGLTFAPELLGIAGGYFADQGLDVALQQTRGSAPAIQSVLANGAPLTRIEQIEGVVHLANRGVPIKNVGTVIKESAIRFVSSSAAPIREPQDFLGKLIGIPSEGGSSDKTLDLVLSNAGIDPSTVERQVVGTNAGVYDLIERGSIQAYAVSIDVANILARQRGNVVTLTPGDFIASGAQFYMVSDDGLVEHRDTIRRYLAAVTAAIEFMVDDDGFDRTLEIMRQRYSFATLADTEIAKASLAEYVGIWTAEGRGNVMRTDSVSWQRGYDELVQANLAEAGHDPSAWFTNELVEAR
ncbi:MAG: ABC transporter substrate-binding protein [Gammaproteobacteria bacterium]|nr:ABC transporter substrate-binding protein [Gammaproteobacteria bacterium]